MTVNVSKFEFWWEFPFKTALVCCALAFCNSSAKAEAYLSEKEALQLVLGVCETQHEPQEILPPLIETLEKEGLEPDSETAHFFKCEVDGDTRYALIDAQIGKHLPITYIVGISSKGTVTRVEMMVFRETIGWQAKDRAFMAQFEGKQSKDDLRIGRKVRHVSGSTISSRAISIGVQRALKLWNFFYGGKR